MLKFTKAMMEQWAFLKEFGALPAETRVEAPLPATILMEVSSHCNLKCTYCATQYNKNNQNMTLETFQGVVGYFRDNGLPARFCINANGEPFMNPALLEMLRTETSDDIVFQIISNGSLIKKDQIADIVRSNLNIIQFSMDSWNKGRYLSRRVAKNNRGENYQASYENILSFLIENEQAGHPVFTSITVMEDHNRDSYDDEFAFWRPLVDNVFTAPLSNFGGLMDNGVEERQYDFDTKPACGHLYDYMYVCADGSLRACCLDALNQYKIGNVQGNDLLGLWNGQRMRAIRRANNDPALLKEADLDGLDCAGCTSPWHGTAPVDVMAAIPANIARALQWKTRRSVRQEPNAARIDLCRRYLAQLETHGEIVAVEQ